MSLVKYFTDGAYCKESISKSKYDGTFAREVVTNELGKLQSYFTT